jgi:hypothetical protein
MAAQKMYPDELRERAVQMVLEIRERGEGQGSWPGPGSSAWPCIRTSGAGLHTYEPAEQCRRRGPDTTEGDRRWSIMQRQR